MEPVAALLSSYLLSISGSTLQNYSNQVNLDVTPVHVQYEGTHVSFQHQVWRIKNKTVCNNLVSNSTEYAHCTEKAKSLFTRICNDLSKRESKSNRHANYQRMYCNASIDYKPMVARISSDAKIYDPKLAKQCNKLILKAMSSKDKQVKADRDRVCKLANN